jgi:uroporphyrinogen decarboxylase
MYYYGLIDNPVYKDFWLPYQNLVVKEFKQAGVENICMYSSGDFKVLLPMMIESGINLTWPLDRNSAMDPVALRKEFGKELRMAGGIPKQVLMDGKEAIDRELEHLMPLIEEGGFFPAPDDMVPPEVPMENFAYLVRQLRAIRR